MKSTAAASLQSIYWASSQIDNVAIAILSHCKSQRGKSLIIRVLLMSSGEKKNPVSLLWSEAKGDGREGCSLSATDWGFPIWPKNTGEKKKNKTYEFLPALTAKLRHLRKRQRSSSSRRAWCSAPASPCFPKARWNPDDEQTCCQPNRRAQRNSPHIMLSH